MPPAPTAASRTTEASRVQRPPAPPVPALVLLAPRLAHLGSRSRAALGGHLGYGEPAGVGVSVVKTQKVPGRAVR